MGKDDYNRGSRDGAKGARRASDNFIFDRPISDDDYDAGYDHAQGQKDAAEGRLSRADFNLFFNLPRNEDAYRKGYKGAK